MSGISDVLNALTNLPGFRSIRPALLRIQGKRLRRLIRAYFASTRDPEIREILDFIKANPQLPLPLGMKPAYPYWETYRSEDVRIMRDPGDPFRHVLFGRNKVYYPAEYTEEDIRRDVVTSLTEQDPRSPHAYLSEQFRVPRGGAAAIAGASNGVFCLSIIDDLSKAYLFEPNRVWIDPLRRTLAPWGDRVEVCPCFLADRDSGDCVTLDTFLRDRAPVQYLQADVEGGERSLLLGAEQTLRRSPMCKVSICCYHLAHDETDLAALLSAFGFAVRYSRGYFLLSYRRPYLRRGVLYASKEDGHDAGSPG